MSHGPIASATVVMSALSLACGPPAPAPGVTEGAGGIQDISAAAIFKLPPRPDRRKLSGRLRELVATGRAASSTAAIARDGQGRVLVEIVAAPGRDAQEIDDALLSRFDARARLRGADRLEAWAPPRTLSRLSRAPAIARVQLPRRPRSSHGPVTSEGVKLIGADRLHCAGGTGKGVAVAVIDLGFGGFAAARVAGEIGATAGPAPGGASIHGTACAEVLHDAAPGVAVRPIQISSLSGLQAAVQALKGQGVQIVSDSLVWFGLSFSDGTGPLCAAVDQARKEGIVWVTSAGNQGNGTFYTGAFVDADTDGRHEFAAGDELNDLALKGFNKVTVSLDWDDYPTSDQDYDLHIYRKDRAGWKIVASSTDVQDGAQPPREEVTLSSPADGAYGVGIERKGGAKPTRLRVFLTTDRGAFTGVVTRLQHWQAASSLEDPAACKSAVTVGGVSRMDYNTGPIWIASSRGPTMDGRIKPDVVAPTGVVTSVMGGFSGTSAAAPHVAGALALYVAATGKSPGAAVDLLLDDAAPMGTPDPNSTYGNGRLILDPARAGWRCEPGKSGACTTSCGSRGAGVCGAACTWAACTPPAETCNGADDDCDGTPDNGFECAAGGSGACITSCGSTGARICSASCAWGSVCAPPAELCNSRDDDCDGLVDEGEVCPRGGGGGCGLDPTGARAGPAAAVLLLLALLAISRQT